MLRTEIHCHFLPGIDDGCINLAESLACLRIMADHGYRKIFCTPHCGAETLTELSTEIVTDLVARLAGEIKKNDLPLELRPGGELRLSPTVTTDLQRNGIPSYGHHGTHILVDIWTPDWPAWATHAVEWLQNRGFTVILAHPERMTYLRRNPAAIQELAHLGLLFQGNLGPIAGADSPEVVHLAERFLQDGRYFMLGSDGHHTDHLPTRLQGLQRAADLIGANAVAELVEKNPARLWKS